MYVLWVAYSAFYDMHFKESPYIAAVAEKLDYELVGE